MFNKFLLKRKFKPYIKTIKGILKEDILPVRINYFVKEKNKLIIEINREILGKTIITFINCNDSYYNKVKNHNRTFYLRNYTIEDLCKRLLK